jgi:PKD repeat protein
VLVPIVLLAGLVAAVPSKGGSAPSSGGVSGTSVEIARRLMCLPVADLASGSTACTAGATWQFAASATGGISPYVYLWSFGDGSGPGYGQTVDHVFPGCGPYLVTVVAIGLAGTGSNSTSVRNCLA